MGKEIPEELKPNSKAQWNDALFKIDDDSPQISEEKSDAFHTFTMKGMFLVKRARQGLEPVFSFSSARIRASMKQD